MAEIYVVRHGQAAFGTDNYDRLTDVGWEQARLLGEYFRSIGLEFDATFNGTMRRHRETLAGVRDVLPTTPSATELPGLNEYDFHALLDLYVPQQGLEVDRSDPRAFYRCLRDVLIAWNRDEIDGVSETWAQFEGRVIDTMEAISQPSGKVLVVTSGGASSAILRRVLGVDVATMVELNLQARNTGISRYFAKNQRFKLNSFNGVPHLEKPQDRHLITYT